MARPGITYQDVATVANSIVNAGDNPTIQKIRSELGTGSPNTIHRYLSDWRATTSGEVPKREIKMPLTTEQIHAIADKLTQQGQRPTLVAVRKALGGGSFSTISEAMQTWRTQQKKENELTEVKIPGVLVERSRQLFATFWQAAIDEAESRLGEERERLTQKQQSSENALKDAKEAVRILETEAEDRDAEIKRLKADLEVAEKRAQEAEELAQQQNLALTQAEMAAASKIEGLEARLADAQRTIDALIARVSEPV